MIVTLTPLLLLCDCVSLCELELDPSFHPVKHSVKLNVCRVTLKTPVSTLRITSVLTHSTSHELDRAHGSSRVSRSSFDVRTTDEKLWPKRCWCATIPRIGMRFGHTETRTLCMIREGYGRRLEAHLRTRSEHRFRTRSALPLIRRSTIAALASALAGLAAAGLAKPTADLGCRTHTHHWHLLLRRSNT